VSNYFSRDEFFSIKVERLIDRKLSQQREISKRPTIYLIRMVRKIGGKRRKTALAKK